MADLNQMLLMNLLQSYAQQGNLQSDPFNPGQANVGAAGAQEAMGGGPGQMETPAEGGGAISPASQQWAEEYAKELGVDPKELLKPASGEIAKQLGVEGVTPDFAGMKQMMLNIAKGHEGMAGQGGGGPAQENPQLRSALAYQAMMANAKAQGGLGGRMVGNLSPLLVQHMVGPYLEQQQAEAQAAAQQKLQLEVAKTAQLGAKRAVEMRKMEAETEYKKQQTIELKAGKDKVNVRVVGDTLVQLDKNGNIVGSTRFPSSQKSYKALDMGSFKAVWPMGFGNDDSGKPLEPIIIKKIPPGSAGVQDELAEARSLIDMAKELKAEYKPEYSGALVGLMIKGASAPVGSWSRIFSDVGQTGLADMVAKAATLGGASTKIPEGALAYAAKLNNYRAKIINLFSGKVVTGTEVPFRDEQLPIITDASDNFLPKLDESASLLNRKKEKAEKYLQGGEAATPAALKNAVVADPYGFVGAPTTDRAGAKGILTERQKKEAFDAYGIGD